MSSYLVNWRVTEVQRVGLEFDPNLPASSPTPPCSSQTPLAASLVPL